MTSAEIVDLDRLEALLAAATPGPWQVGTLAPDSVVAPNGDTDGHEQYYGHPLVCESVRGNDRILIAELRNAAPALIRIARASRERGEESP